MTYYRRCYEMMRDKYEGTKPIRGRSVDVRPIDRRRRDWETVVKNTLPDGTVTYGAQLYNTEVVRYLPNGSVQLKIDTWATPITADFMSRWSPFVVRKKSKMLWVAGHTIVDDKAYPIPYEGVLEFAQAGDYRWELASGLPPTLPKKVVDRWAMKERRKAIKPFLDYATTLLKLSDGWVMHETMAQYKKPDDNDWTGWHVDFGLGDAQKVIQNAKHFAKSPELVEMLMGFAKSNDRDKWDRLMYAIVHRGSPEDSQIIRKESFQIPGHGYQRDRVYTNRRYSVDTIKKFMDFVLKKDESLYTTKEVELGCVHHNLVI